MNSWSYWIFVIWKTIFHTSPYSQYVCDRVTARKVTSTRRLWWDSLAAPIIAVNFISLSEPLLCPFRIDPEWRRQQGARALLTGAQRSFPTSFGDWVHRPPGHCGLWPAAILTGGAQRWPQKLILTARVCVCVCVHADDVYDLVCSCWMKGGLLTGEPLLFPHVTKVHPFIFKADGCLCSPFFLPLQQHQYKHGLA